MEFINSTLPMDECKRLNATNYTAFMLQANYTLCLEHAPTLSSDAYVQAIVLAVLTVLSFIGNALTIYSIQTSRYTHRSRQQYAVYTLIMHLSVADLLVTVFCLGGDAAWTYAVAWSIGNAACKVFKFLQMFSIYLSTFILVLIGVDRFLAVRYPIKSLSTARRCNRLIVFVWILSAVLSVPQIFVFSSLRGPFYEEFYQCVTFDFYTERWQEQLYTSFTCVFNFILPLIILISTYVSTVNTIARSEKMFQAEAATSAQKSDVNRRRLIHRAKIKSFRISVVIVAAFIIWWTPYYIMMWIFQFFDPDQKLGQNLRKGIFFFGMSNSLVNPVIYGAFHLWRPARRQSGSYRDGSTRQSNLTRLGRAGTLKDDTTTFVLLEAENGSKI